MRPDLLADWLPRQRWFAGKGRPVSSFDVVAEVTLGRTSDAELRHVIVRVHYFDGPAERYQLLTGHRTDLPQRLEYAAIGRTDDVWAYDALHDPELMALVLDRLIAERDEGPLSFRRLPHAELHGGLPGRVLTAEQSNSSVIYGDTYILKFFRKVAAGLNPDLEITRVLALVGSTHVAAPLAWIEGSIDGEPATFAMLQPFFTTATEGWQLATTSVRDLYAEEDLHANEVGGDFAAEAERLGAATAEVHEVLARELPTEEAAAEQLKALAGQMQERLDAAVAAVGELAPHAEALRTAYDAVGALAGPVRFQRIHGDYHLGQVLRTDSGWVLLDFEGEPAKPLAERVRPDSPLRDVAGMLRSFDYAARFLLAEQGSTRTLAFRAGEWAERNRSAFCDGYAVAAGRDPRDDETLLRAYELDKAVYEVMYEARMRPAWLPIPLGSIARLTG
jgi:maltokinase